jgi:UDP-N-acetylglucosamine acyltransferase
MVARVHPTAVVESGAVLGENVRVGAHCYVAADVELGAGTELCSHVSVLGPTRIGKHNQVFPFATLGAAPQDRSYAGEPTELVIGENNVIREQVTIHRGTVKGGGVTRVGSGCLLMVGAHVAHDCSLEDGVVLTNLSTLGGHVRIESFAVCGGLAAIAPFVRLGRACFVSGGAMVERDVPPFVIASGDRARVRALNRVGLKRLGVPEASRHALKRAFCVLFRSGATLDSRLRSVELELAADPFVSELVRFLRQSGGHSKNAR